MIFSLVQDDFIIGSIFATMGVVAFFLLPFAGRIVDRFGTFRVSLFQFGILAVTGIGLALADSIELFWCFAAVYTIGEVLNVAQQVLLTDHVPNNIRGTIMGLDAAMDKLLGVAAPFLAGLLILAVGIKFTFLFFMSLYAVSLLAAIFVYVRFIKNA